MDDENSGGPIWTQIWEYPMDHVTGKSGRPVTDQIGMGLLFWMLVNAVLWAIAIVGIPLLLSMTAKMIKGDGRKRL